MFRRMLVSLGRQIYANNSLFLKWRLVIVNYFANYMNIHELKNDKVRTFV